jgi:hypothetical protein
LKDEIEKKKLCKEKKTTTTKRARMKSNMKKTIMEGKIRKKIKTKNYLIFYK